MKTIHLKNTIYKKYSERMPIMLGFSVPTFFFDHLSFEIEYLNNPHVESRTSSENLTLVPYSVFRSDTVTFNEDDIKWSIHGRKSLTKNISIFIHARS